MFDFFKEQRKILDISDKLQRKDEVIDLLESFGVRRKNWLSSLFFIFFIILDEFLLYQYFFRYYDYVEILNSESEFIDNIQLFFILKVEENVNRLSDNYDNVDNVMFFFLLDDTDLLQFIDQVIQFIN